MKRKLSDSCNDDFFGWRFFNTRKRNFLQFFFHRAFFSHSRGFSSRPRLRFQTKPFLPRHSCFFLRFFGPFFSRRSSGFFLGFLSCFLIRRQHRRFFGLFPFFFGRHSCFCSGCFTGLFFGRESFSSG